MKKVISEYEITNQTLALLPAKQIGYDTIVIERSVKKYVQKTSFQLIKEACLDNWITYEGWREAVIYHTNFKQRTPIPISPVKRLYFFPTHSPNNMNNSWIAALQILHIKELPRHEQTKDAQSMVTFICGKTLKLDVSLHTLDTQWKRTLECMTRIENKWKENM